MMPDLQKFSWNKLLFLSHTHIHADRPKEAEEAYRTALAFKPDHLNGNTNMGHLCRLQGRWEEARRYFTSALARRPNLPTLHYFLGVASEEIGTQRDIEVKPWFQTYVCMGMNLCEWEWIVYGADCAHWLHYQRHKYVKFSDTMPVWTTVHDA